MKDSYYLDPRTAASYDVENPGLPGDVEFYRGLALEAAAQGFPVLELACGTGRVTIPIAAAGVEITGLDRSPVMLAIAREKAGGATNPAWVEADMTEFELGRRFGLVMIPYRSFLHLETVSAQKSCLAAARRHLVDGGRLALNFFNPDLLYIATNGAAARPSTRQARRPAEGGRITRHFDQAAQRMDEERIDDVLSDEGAVVQRVYRNLRLRYVFRYEMEHLLALNRFTIEALYGGFKGEPFIDESSEMVWVAKAV